MLYMSVDSIHCEETTSGLGSDEPYVIVATADLKGGHVQVGGFDVLYAVP